MGIYKRGRVWWMGFTYQGRNYRRSTEVTDRKLAQRIYDKIKGDIAEGKWFEKLPGEEKSFKEMMEKYLNEHVSKKLSSKSFRSHSKTLVSHFGEYTLKDITPRLISEYKVKRLNEESKPGTLNRELATMKKAFNLAIKEWEWIKENPVARISLEQEDKRIRWLNDDEEKRLLEKCSEWLKELVIFALNTGMRKGEVLSLTWRGVDLFRKTITIFESKNKEARTIPMSQKVFDLLKSKSKVRSIKTDLVFHDENHEPISYVTLHREFHTTLNQAEIQDMRWHDLRHCFATKLVREGKDLYKVQKLLGHKTPIMTQRYAHHDIESLRDAVEVLDKASVGL